MAINPIMMSALKAISYADVDMTRIYKLGRIADTITHAPVIRNYKMWDVKVEREGYPIPVRIFEPKEYRSDGIIMFIHGGGWVSGNIDSYIKPCALLADVLGRRVASVDYRLAPEYPFPCGVEDCYHVAREITHVDGLRGTGREGVTIMGDSAGGNISAVVSLMARDRGEFTIPRQVLLYPATHNDHESSSPYPSVVENGTDYLLTSKRVCEYISLYISRPEDMFSPYFAPILAEDLSGQPDTLIITAEYDPLRDEGEAYYEKIRLFGNYAEAYRMPDALHGFLMLSARFEHVRELHNIVDRFLDERGVTYKQRLD